MLCTIWKNSLKTIFIYTTLFSEFRSCHLLEVTPCHGLRKNNRSILYLRQCLLAHPLALALYTIEEIAVSELNHRIGFFTKILDPNGTPGQICSEEGAEASIVANLGHLRKELHNINSLIEILCLGRRWPWWRRCRRRSCLGRCDHEDDGGAEQRDFGSPRAILLYHLLIFYKCVLNTSNNFGMVWRFDWGEYSTYASVQTCLKHTMAETLGRL